MTRKQQQLGENKKVRLWSTGNSYSRYGSKPEDVFEKHVKDLMQFAEKNIPADQHNETPLFILATAGK